MSISIKIPKWLRLFLLFCLFVFLGVIAFLLYMTKDEINARPDTVTDQINSFFNEDKIAGFSVALFSADEVIYSKGFGYRDLDNRLPYQTDTRQYLASVAKTNIGLALLKAEELDLLQLDDPISKHLNFELINPAFPDQEITIRQLATHTSSLDYNEKVVESLYVADSSKQASLEGFVQNYFVNKKYGSVTFTDQAPGTIFNYSNIGAGLAAYLIERVSGQSFAAFTQQYLFDPLNMKQTSWWMYRQDSSKVSRYYEIDDNGQVNDVPSDGVQLYPARDLISSAEDMVRFGQAVLAKDDRLLTPASYQQLLAPQLGQDVINENSDNQGIFWNIDRNQFGVTYELTGMNGGDYCISTMFWLDPATQLGYLFIGNTGAAPQNRLSHILTFNALISLGKHHILNDPNRTFGEKIQFRWYDAWSRVTAVF